MEGCPACGETAPWGRFDTRLCGAHHQKWVKDGKPACTRVAVGAAAAEDSQADRALRVVACARSVECAGLCGAHRSQWVQAGRPALERFASSARPVASGDARCRVAGLSVSVRATAAGRVCATRTQSGFTPGGRIVPSWSGRTARSSDTSSTSAVCGAHAMLACLALPDAQLVALELRFVLQHRHDEGGGFIHSFRWSETVGRLNDDRGAVAVGRRLA